MISVEDAPFTYEFDAYFKILPSIKNDPKYYGINKVKKVNKNFSYISDNNKFWITSNELKRWLKKYQIIFKLNKILLTGSTGFLEIILIHI